jgi:hypothetical protein
VTSVSVTVCRSGPSLPRGGELLTTADRLGGNAPSNRVVRDDALAPPRPGVVAHEIARVRPERGERRCRGCVRVRPAPRPTRRAPASLRRLVVPRERGGDRARPDPAESPARGDSEDRAVERVHARDGFGHLLALLCGDEWDVLGSLVLIAPLETAAPSDRAAKTRRHPVRSPQATATDSTAGVAAGAAHRGEEPADHPQNPFRVAMSR